MSEDSIGAFAAKTHLSALLERVEKGESITITKHGLPVARLVPAPLHARRQVPDRVPPTPEEHAEFMRRHQERAGVALYPLTP